MKTDADIVAVKFKLSSRHPVFDICDMYAKADMYGLGAGIYPKDKLPPLPVHPHCLCRYVEVIEGEVDMKQQRDQVREAGDKWLNSLPESRRCWGVEAWRRGKTVKTGASICVVMLDCGKWRAEYLNLCCSFTLMRNSKLIKIMV